MKYEVLHSEFANTGGNCTVSTFELYNAEENKTEFLHVNEEGGSLATVDYIGREIDYTDNMLISSFSIDTLKNDDENFELYRDCFFKYVKRDCLYFGNTYTIPQRLFPKELLQQVSLEYLEWMSINGITVLETNGVKIIYDDAFEPFSDIMYAFQEFLTELLPSTPDDEEREQKRWEELYDTSITITICGKTLSVPFCATTYEAVRSLVQDYIANEL